MYLGMGWGVIVCYARIVRVVSHPALLPWPRRVVLQRGSGAQPAPLARSRPGIFGVHDLFHLFVIAGSLAHYWFILKVVVPFESGNGEVFGESGTSTEDEAIAPCSARRLSSI